MLRVETAGGNWLAPPQRAVWVPPGVSHAVASAGPAAFRSLYITADIARDLPDAVTVIEVGPLLRELIRAVAALPPDYDPDGPDGRLVAVVLDRLQAAAPAPLHLPLPRDRRLAGIAQALIETPADRRSLSDFARGAGASPRTLARLFQRETGLTFGQWRTRRRLLAAIERLADGEAVTTVAYDLGYDSPSAFIAMFRRETGETPARYFVR
jgi:AraC-like DNA-binding protein